MNGRRRTGRILLAGAVAGLAALVVLRARSAAVPIVGGARTDLVRLHLRLDPSYVRTLRERSGQRAMLADVGRRIEALGYSGPWPCLQDPTDNGRATVIASARGKGRSPTGDGAVRVEREERVSPPAGARRGEKDAIGAFEREGPRLEPWLTAEEVRTLHHALTRETNARHLRGVASTFEPLAPTAASMLRAKATILDPRRQDPRTPDERVRELREDLRSVPPSDPSTLARIDAARIAVEAYARRYGIPLDVVHDEVKHEAYRAASGDRGLSKAPLEIRALGALLARDLPRGGAVVDPDRVLRACPPTGREAYVSGSALWLAHASQRPETSGVRDPEAIARRFDEVDGRARSLEEHVELLRARRMLDRAEKTLARRRWTTWYDRRPWS